MKNNNATVPVQQNDTHQTHFIMHV